VGTTPGAAAKITAKMTLLLGFKEAATPTARDAYVQKLDLDMDAAGHTIKMKLDNDQLTIADNGEPMTIKRGEAGPLDVAGMLDTPFTSIDLSHNKIEVRTNAANPFTALGGDMLDDAMMLFPDLPEEPIQPGHTWKVVRRVPVGAGLGKAEITYDFRYDGDGACPSGAKACADLSFTAASKDVSVVTEGVTVKATYGFAGKVYLDTGRGIVDESRVRMDMDVKAQGQSLPMGGTFVIKPTS
jgi:hypothetical protein